MQIRVVGQRELQALARDLTRGAKHLRPELTKGLRQPTEAVERDVKHAIETADMSGRRTTARRRFTARIPSKGVRRPTARAVEGKVSTSAGNPTAEVTLNPAHVPRRIRALIPYWGGDKKRLRHPIMGRRSRWVGQNLPDVWTGALKPHIRRYRAEAQAALDRVRDQIAKG